MTRETTSIDRRTYLATTGAVTVGMAGCLGGETGTLATQVTDQPGDIADFGSCVVSIVGMWLGPEGAEAGADPTGREYHEYDGSQEADLVELQNGATQLVDERTLDATSYQFLQLDVDDVDATLQDGSDATVEVPGTAPLTFDESFDVRADTHTTFTADFTPVRLGGADGYTLQPVPDGITVEYEDDA